MDAYARWLFGAAAVCNWIVGLGLILLRPMLEGPIGLEPLNGVGLMFSNLTGLLITIMGWVYALVAFDPARYRPLILVGAVGKLLAVVCVIIPRLGGEIPVALPSLIMGDAIYAALFLHYLWISRARAEPSET